MAEQHKAKRVHWLAIEVDSRNFATASTILELLHRIEALEAAQQAKPNHPEKPDSSLVERVESAISANWNESSPGFRVEARAAIREVAAWLQEQKSYGHGWAAITLEQEAER